MGSHFELSMQSLLVKPEKNEQSREPAHPCLKSLSCGSLHIVCSSVRGPISCWSPGQVFHTAHKSHSAAECFAPHCRRLQEFRKRSKDLDSLKTSSDSCCHELNGCHPTQQAAAVIFGTPGTPGEASAVTTAVDRLLEGQPQSGMPEAACT